MKTTKIILILFMLIMLGNIFAAYIQLTFKETQTNPMVTLTRQAVLLENPSYALSPNPIATNRWVIQVYKSTDNVIDTVDSNGLPTNDDIVVNNFGGTSTQGLVFATDNTWFMSSMRFYDDGVTGNAFVGDKIYLRIFNSNSIATATKCIQSTVLYTVPVTTTVLNYIAQRPLSSPDYGWSAWIDFRSTTPSAAALLAPTPTGTTVSNYSSGQTLSWAAGTGNAPTGFKVYFGTDNSPTNIINGTSQTNTSYNTGALLPNQIYYWKIIPYNASGDATSCPIWSFTTRAEFNPNPAYSPVPAILASVTTNTFPYYQALSWTAPVVDATHPAATGYKFYWNNAYLYTIVTTSTTVSIPSAGTYTWQVIPFYTDLGTRTTINGDAVSVRGDATGCPIWSFTTSLETTYTIDITSTPTDADIFVGGVDSGFNTPHTFTMNAGTGATYTVQKTGYTWLPVDYVVTNIQANASQNFTGSLVAPTIQASGVNFTGVQATQATTNWTRGNGTNCLVFVREGSIGTPGNPVDGTTYTASSDWAAPGTQLGTSGYYCVYNGAGNNVTVTNLLAGTNYYAIAYEYNGSGATSVYMTGGGTGNTTTLALPPLINVTGTLTNFGSVIIGSNSTEQTYSVSASNLTANLILTAPTGFQVSTTSGSGFGSSVTLTPVSGTVNATTIFVRFTPIFTGVSSGNISNASTNATTQNVAVSGTGINIPVITDPTSASITSTTAVLGGNITSLNSSSVTERGIYYSTINGFADGAGIKISEFGSYSSGLFTLSVTGLSQGITYYFKAFATNAAGTSYTTQYSFTTLTSTYTVDITSTPTDADIFVGGVDSGFNTPHQFVLNYGSNATYTVQKAGYTWSPSNLTVTNIQSNTSQEFTGLIITYTMDITSSPTDADIYVGGIDSGFNTPHQFVMDYGTSATFTMYMAGYTWQPAEYNVANIQSNTSQLFQGNPSPPATLPLSEDFEGAFPPAGWTISGWTHSNTLPNTGTYCISTSNTGAYIISPLMANPGILQYYHRKSTGNVQFTLATAPTTTGPWTTVSGYPVFAGSGWSLATNDLSGLTNVYLRWMSNGTSTMYIDDISIAVATIPLPSISVTGLVTDFGSVKVGESSAEQSYSVSATNLTSNLVITTPTGFQVSTTSGAGFGTTVTLTPASGTVSATTIYVRFSPGATGVLSGDITHVSAGATTQNRAVSGTGINNPFITTPTSSSITFTTAILGGNITNINLSDVTERGIYYSTINGFADGAGIKISEFGSYSSGLFTLSVTGLSQGITYYFKAFATNAAGTGYTIQASFITPVNEPPIVNLPETITINQNELTGFDFSGYISDPEGDALSLTVTGNTNIDVQINGLSGTFHPSTNWIGSEVLTFSVSDSVSIRRTIVTDQVTIHVINPLVVDFSTNSELNNNVVANDSLTSLHFSVVASFPLTSYQWDFNNDNIIDSALPAPTYLYTTPGLKTVTLTATDNVHVTTVTKIDFINVLSGTLVPPQVFDTDIIWTEAGGPYNISGELVLNSGLNLIVEPNAQVNLMVDSLLIINGTINAQDAFFNAYGPNGWGGIVLNPGANNSVINGINLYGAANGLTINGCNPTLSNMEINGNSVGRTITTGITVNADAAPTISNVRINNFNQGIIASNALATQQNINLSGLVINRQSNNASQDDVGILINGNYNTNLQDIVISDYPHGVEIINDIGNGRPLRLTNSRVIKTESSTRNPSTAIRIVNASYVSIDNDSLIGFTKGIEIENTSVLPTDLRIAANRIDYNAINNSPDFAIQVSGNTTGYIDSLVIVDYSSGIILNGNQSLQIEQNTMVNCGTAFQDNQNQQNHLIKRNTIYRNIQFNGFASSPALSLNQSTNLTVINNTFYNYPVYANAAGASNLSYEQNIAWCSIPDANPIILTDGSIINATYNDIALLTGSYLGIGNINADPMFVNAAESDFSLSADSPCINSGNPANPHDSDGTIADLGSLAVDIFSIPLIADFICDAISGQHPLTVQFTDHSSSIVVARTWDFDNDNTIDSNEENPVWIYSTPGNYTVKLTVWDGIRYQSRLCPNLITVQNVGPIIILPLPDLTRIEDFSTFQIDLSSYFSDENGDPLDFSFIKDSDNVNASLSQNILTISSVPDSHGIVNFTITAEDGIPLQREQNSTLSRTSVKRTKSRIHRALISDNFTLVVTPVNDAPLINLPETFTCAEDSILVINMAQYVSDIDNTNLILTAQNSTHISADINGLNVTISASANWFGTEQLTFYVNDNSGRLMASDSTNVIVTPVNDLPVITNFTPQQQTITAHLGETCTFGITAYDIDSPLQYSWYVNDSLQDDSDNSLTYQFNTSSPYNVKTVVSDGEFSLEHTWTVQIVTGIDDNVAIICTALNRIYPNPFSFETKVDYQLKNPSLVKIDVFNVKGQLISTLINKIQPSGMYTANWNILRDNKTTLSNGIYYIRVSFDHHYEIRRVLLIK